MNIKELITRTEKEIKDTRYWIDKNKEQLEKDKERIKNLEEDEADSKELLIKLKIL